MGVVLSDEHVGADVFGLGEGGRSTNSHFSSHIPPRGRCVRVSSCNMVGGQHRSRSKGKNRDRVEVSVCECEKRLHEREGLVKYWRPMFTLRESKQAE